MYPKNCKQPIKENYLLNGKLEKTNEPYAIAKIAGIKMCESYNAQYNTNFKCLMPCNTYGIGDNYHQENGHLLPALLITADSCSPFPSRYKVLIGPIQIGFPPISAIESFNVRIKDLETVQICIFSCDG